MTPSEQAKYDTVVAQRNEALNTLAQQNGFIADLQARIAELESMVSVQKDAPVALGEVQPHVAEPEQHG